jgi:hypothetical protein
MMSEKGWRFLGVGKELGGIKEMFKSGMSEYELIWKQPN